MSPDRAQLRQSLREHRRSVPAAVRIAAAESLAQHLLALPFAPTVGHVAGYWAMDGEIALHAWQLQLPSTLTYCLPVLCDDMRLRFAAWRPGAGLTANRFGIPEPGVPPASLIEAQDMALVVVPVVGFDVHGQRLGMGGGWYDRSFAARRQNDHAQNPAPPWLVGAAFAAQRIDAIAAESWDVSLDAICTERETLLINGVPA